MKLKTRKQWRHGEERSYAEGPNLINRAKNIHSGDFAQVYERRGNGAAQQHVSRNLPSQVERISLISMQSERVRCYRKDKSLRPPISKGIVLEAMEFANPL